MMLFMLSILWVFMGGVTSYMAKNRGRDPYLWFAIGVLFGLIGLLVLVLLPKVIDKVENGNKPDIENSAVQNSLDPWKEWFYVDSKGGQVGPLSVELLKDQWKIEGVNGRSFVWTEGMDSWKRIEEEPFLFQFLTK